MPLAVTVTKTWDDGKVLHAVGSLVASGSYTTGGDTLNFGTTSRIKSTRTPVWVDVVGINNAFFYRYVAGTSLQNGKLKAYTSAGVEASAAAYPAGITGETIQFHGLFVKLR